MKCSQIIDTYYTKTDTNRNGCQGGVEEGAGSGRINNDKNTNFISMATQSHRITVLTQTLESGRPEFES